MDTPSESMIFNDNEDARKFFYLYENAVTQGLPDTEKAEKLWPIKPERHLTSTSTVSRWIMARRTKPKTMVKYKGNVGEVFGSKDRIRNHERGYIRSI